MTRAAGRPSGLPPAVGLRRAGGRRRVLFIGHGVKPTGRARVTEAIVSRLLGHCDVIQFAPNWYGAAREQPWVLWPNTVQGDPYGRTQLAAIIARARPDVIVLNCECWEYGLYAPVLARVRPSRVILHCPVEGPLTRTWPAEAVSLLDVVVTNTDFGRRQLRDVLAGSLPPGSPLPPVTVIPHGVDTRTFRPLAAATDSRMTPGSFARARRASAAQARRRLFGAGGLPGDAFLILNGNRDNGRKRLDLTLAAFELFARDKPGKVLLYLQAGAGPRGRARERRWADARIVRTRAADGWFPALPDESLNLVYNACDVGINTAAAEACGLVGLEHAAAGAPQIMPALGTCQEMWGGAALLVPAALQGTPPGEWFEYHASAPADLAAAMERLYRDRELLAQSSWDCYTRATQAGWSWDSVTGQWRELLRA